MLPILLVPTMAAAADAEDAPFSFGATLQGKLQGEYVAPKGAKARVGLYSDDELAFHADHAKWLSLNGDIKLERTRNDNLNSYYPDRNTVLRSESLTLRQLYVTLRPADGVAVYAGKIHPRFASGYVDTPGLFYSFATDYEQDERIGAGVELTLPESLHLGDLRAAIEVFHLDTSVLSYSFPRGPSLNDPTADRAWRYAPSQFGPSNTGDVSSWTASLKSGEAGKGLAWQLSATHETTAQPGTKPEDGQSVSASYAPGETGIALTEHLGLTPFAEYTHFTNFRTLAGLERHYWLAGLAFKSGPWELDLAAGQRTSRGAASGTDQQQNLTLTYELVEGLRIGAGLNHVVIASRPSWAVGPALSYLITF